MQTHIEPGSIVEFNERQGDPAYIAVVQHVWPDQSLQLFVFQFQAAANVRAAPRDQCKLLMGPGQYESTETRIRRLEDTVNFLMQHPPATKGRLISDVAPTSEDEPEDELDAVTKTTLAYTEKKPWPKSKRAVADPVPD